ncbi:MAG: glycosyltransferase family 2 protein [Elusimicrobia bacterium]|nr:glycosyltransferase family 2 protein [Elusimicrobiota bacterium]
MTAPFEVTVVIPAFNEVKRIAETVGEARAYFKSRGRNCEIIVVADGDDGTREKVAEMAKSDPALKVLGGPERRGKGRGVREGVLQAQGEIIGFVDADNKTPIDEYDKFEPLLKKGADVVIGSRKDASQRPENPQRWYRRVGAKGFALAMHALVGLPDIADTQCGFKFFKRKAALDLFGRQKIDGYIFDVEILVHASKSGCRIEQVPIRWRDDGDSRLDLFAGNVRNFLDLMRIAAGT